MNDKEQYMVLWNDVGDKFYRVKIFDTALCAIEFADSISLDSNVDEVEIIKFIYDNARSGIR